ncbi:peroxin [Vermiconidia calcicola]|uniref:Peroxin n=1 Tax=Vermiconidia calcicola TaxID=1690605 RepID=A0ACC3NJ01_9PEZI|nr:peroxin [Vermiconidia calcicola]
MLATSRRWFRRNRTTLLVGAGVVGAGYVATQYVVGKIQEARQRMGEDRIAKDNLRRRFEQNQEDCTYTVLALLPTIREEIIGALPVEQITEQLQRERQERLRKLGQSETASTELPSGPPSVADDASLRSSDYVHASQMASSSMEGGAAASPRPKRSKAQLWQEMKINSITRALTLLYTVSLLTMLTRVQLNLLGRRTYLSSVITLASPPAPIEESKISMENRDDDNYDNMYGNDFETNRKYLTFSWWLLHRGSKQIMDRVMGAVKEVFGGVNIRDDVSLDRLRDLIMQVRKKVEGATEEDRRQMDWLQYLLPPKEDESFVIRQSTMSGSEDSPSPEPKTVEDPMSASAVEAEAISDSLRRLLDETSDLIDSPTFVSVLSKLLDASFSHLIDYRLATEAFNATGPTAPGTSLEEPRITEITDTKCKVAHMLPIFCKQAHVIAAGSGDLDAIAGVAAQQSLGNEYLATLDRVQDLGAFAAVIYSSNFEYEVAKSASTTAPHSEGTPSSSSSSSSSSSQPAVPIPTDLPSSVTEVQEVEPKPVSDDGLEESAILLPSESVDPAAEPSAEGGFESAWKKALADEDGKQAGD